MYTVKQFLALPIEKGKICEQARWGHGNEQKSELEAIEEFANLYCKLLEGTKKKVSLRQGKKDFKKNVAKSEMLVSSLGDNGQLTVVF